MSKVNVQRLNPQESAHLIAPTALLLDLVYLPLFSVDLAPHFLLGFAVPGRSVFSVIVNDVIQGVLELIETRKCRHGGIEMDITERWRGRIGGGYKFRREKGYCVRCGSPRGGDIDCPLAQSDETIASLDPLEKSCTAKDGIESTPALFSNRL